MAENLNPHPKKNFKQGKLIWVGGCGCLLLVILISLGLFLYAGWQGYQESPKSIEVQSKKIHYEDPYILSSPQEEQLYSYGYPDAFTILFYEEETLSGSADQVRLEVWDYYSQGLSLTFLNGDLITEDQLLMDTLGLVEPLMYYPEQFSAFMNLEQLIAAADIDHYVEIPLENGFVDEGVVFYSNGLTFGLKNNALIYIEALALSE